MYPMIILFLCVRPARMSWLDSVSEQIAGVACYHMGEEVNSAMATYGKVGPFDLLSRGLNMLNG